MELLAFETGSIGGIMDGHTKAGSYEITITLTKDQIDQLTRSMEWAKMMDSHDDNPPQYKQDNLTKMEVIAHRAFLQEILDILYAAVPERSKTV